jgi:hypothetical protein
MKAVPTSCELFDLQAKFNQYRLALAKSHVLEMHIQLRQMGTVPRSCYMKLFVG